MNDGVMHLIREEFTKVPDTVALCVGKKNITVISDVLLNPEPITSIKAPSLVKADCGVVELIVM